MSNEIAVGIDSMSLEEKRTVEVKDLFGKLHVLQNGKVHIAQASRGDKKKIHVSESGKNHYLM